jgi:hypothetical protein
VGEALAEGEALALAAWDEPTVVGIHHVRASRCTATATFGTSGWTALPAEELEPLPATDPHERLQDCSRGIAAEPRELVEERHPVMGRALANVA